MVIVKLNKLSFVQYQCLANKYYFNNMIIHYCYYASVF